MNGTLSQQPFQTQQPTTRKVSFLLGLGIFLFPLIFAWFTLRAGHSTLSRVISFIWLVLSLIFIFATPSGSSSATSQTEPSALVSSNEQAQEASVEQTPSVEQQAPTTIQITARELHQYYEANEVAADRKFKGQVIEISGSVQSIDSGIDDGANVQFNVGDEYGLASVTASGDANFNNYSASLVKGQKISLRCIGAGEIVGQPFLDNCQPI